MNAFPSIGSADASGGAPADAPADLPAEVVFDTVGDTNAPAEGHRNAATLINSADEYDIMGDIFHVSASINIAASKLPESFVAIPSQRCASKISSHCEGMWPAQQHRGCDGLI